MAADAVTVVSRESARERAPHLGPERRRPLVLDAALKLFVKNGYGGTSMEAIAQAAGVTKPVVYDCFPSKEKLFRALLEREERRLLEAVAASMPREASAENIEALLISGFTALIEAAAAAPDSWRVVFDSEHGADPMVARRVRRAREDAVARLRALIEPVLPELGVSDPARKASVLAELLASMGEAGVRVFLASKSSWTPAELGRLLGQVTARGPAAA